MVSIVLSISDSAAVHSPRCYVCSLFSRPK